MSTPIKVAVDTDFSSVIREAAKGADAVDDLGDAFGEAEDASKSAGRGIDRGMDDAASSVGDVDSAVGDMAGSLSEVGGVAQSALEGDLGGAAQSAVGAVGDLAGAIPGIGAAATVVAGLAGAAIGQITEAWENAQAASDEAKESAYQYGLTVAGTSQYADVAGRINDLTGSVEGLANVTDIATVSGWKQVDVVRALATGDGLPALYDAFDKGANSTTVAGKRVLELNGILEGTQQGFALSAGAASIQAAALYDVAVQAGVATGEVDDLGNTIVQMPDGKTVVLDADAHEAYEDIDALENKQLTPKTLTLTANDSSVWAKLDALNAAFARTTLKVNVAPVGTGTVLKPGSSQKLG